MIACCFLPLRFYGLMVCKLQRCYIAWLLKTQTSFIRNFGLLLN